MRNINYGHKICDSYGDVKMLRIKHPNFLSKIIVKQILLGLFYFHPKSKTTKVTNRSWLVILSKNKSIHWLYLSGSYRL